MLSNVWIFLTNLHIFEASEPLHVAMSACKNDHIRASPISAAYLTLKPKSCNTEVQKEATQMIQIVPYNECWPKEFAEIGSVLRRVLGDLAVRIDHIGSTSIPGLASKDCIDVQLTVRSFKPFEPVQTALGSVGYEFRAEVTSDHQPPGTDTSDGDWEKRYFKPPTGQRATHLHVRAEGRANQRYPLLFRDYLRCHPKCADAYAELKRRLAQYHGTDRLVYTTIKDPVCDIVMGAAEEWASLTGWRPGPSDA
jgi:GrpB-like predicted nucleotidyltransferase (UPF0157 family)